MALIVRLSMLLLLLRLGSCGFLDPSQALVLTRPAGSNSLFGYQVAAMRIGNELKLLMSDPTGENSATRTTSGAVYKCAMPRISRTEIRQACDTQLPLKYDDKRRDSIPSVFQFGASMQATDNGDIVVCAPGYNFVSEFKDRTATPGLCNFWRRNSSEPKVMQDIMNYLNHMGRNMEAYSHTMAGSQVAMSVDEDAAYFGIGAPFSQRSVINVVRLDGKNMTPTEIEGQCTNMIAGMSVLWDRKHQRFAFFDAQKKATPLAALLKKDKKTASCITTSGVKPSFYAFRRIGFSSIEIKVSDTSSNFVLGGPYNPDPANIDVGCIYLVSDSLMAKYLHEYCHTELNARFGTSLVNLDDINGDGIEDFAVGCPACGKDGAGAVFLFLAQPSSFRLHQIIRAPEVSANLSGFGWSLAKMPGRGPGDPVSLVIGSINSQHVVVLPGRKLMKFTATTDLRISKSSETRLHVMNLVLKIERPAFTNAKDFEFQVRCRLSEVPYNGVRRFSGQPADPSEAVAGDWVKQNVAGKTELTSRFNLKFRPETEWAIPVDVQLRPLKPRFECRVEDRSTADGSPFPALLVNGKSVDGYEFNATFEIPMESRIYTSNRFELELLSPSNVTLKTTEPVKVRLRVKKNNYVFIGGAGIRINASKGVKVEERVAIKDSNATIKYFQELNELYFISNFREGLHKPFKVDQELNITLTFSAESIEYWATFDLFTVSERTEYYCHNCATSQAFKPEAVSVMVRYNSSVTMALVGSTDKSHVIDSRTSVADGWEQGDSSKAKLPMGPMLSHGYTLKANPMPRRPVGNVTIELQVPLRLGDERLLYFPRQMMDSLTGNFQPGKPYVDIESPGQNLGSGAAAQRFECRVADENGDFLRRMSETLVAGAHVTNRTKHVHSRRRREAVAEASLGSSSSTKPQVEEIFDCADPDKASVRFTCVTFSCAVPELFPTSDSSSTGVAKLHLHAMIWSPTFIKLKMYKFRMTSRAVLKWQKPAYFARASVTNTSHVNQTFEFWNLSNRPAPFPWWYLILAVFCGIWLLLLLILLLWYCNFFARKRHTVREYSEVPQKPSNEDEDFYR